MGHIKKKVHIVKRAGVNYTADRKALTYFNKEILMREWLVYCAGPMTGISFEESNHWRQVVAERLPEFITAISPLRRKKYLEGKLCLEDCSGAHIRSSQHAILQSDFFDVRRSDLVLVNFLGIRRASIGSIMEIAWAYALQKPLVVALDRGTVHDYSLIRASTGFIVHTLDEAINCVTDILEPTVAI